MYRVAKTGRWFLRWFVACLVLGVSFSAQADKQFIVTGLNVSEARQLVGYLNSAYRQLGISPLFQFTNGQRSLKLTNIGQSDAEVARVEGLEKKFPNLIPVKVPMYITEMAAVVEADSDIYTFTWDDLDNYSTIYDSSIELLKMHTKDSMSTGVADIKTMLNMLQRDRVQVALMLKSVALEVIGERKDLRILEKPIAEANVFHYVHKRHVHLVPKLESIFRKQNKERNLN